MLGLHGYRIRAGSRAAVKLSATENAFLRFISRTNSARLHQSKDYLQRPSTLLSYVGLRGGLWLIASGCYELPGMTAWSFTPHNDELLAWILVTSVTVSYYGEDG